MTRNKLLLIGAGVSMLCSVLAFLPDHLPAQSSGQNSLIVRLAGFRNAAGNVRVALRRDENTVIATREIQIDPKTLTAQTSFEGLPEGTYGVAVFHDENKNGKLDFNEAGVPLEGYGHSNNPAKRTGPPSFDETKFTVTAPETSIEIQMIYWL